MANRKISWDTQALQEFNAAINYIARDSLQGAEKVRQDILKKIHRLPTHPTLHNPDKYKKDNDGNFRYLNCTATVSAIMYQKLK